MCRSTLRVVSQAGCLFLLCCTSTEYISAQHTQRRVAEPAAATLPIRRVELYKSGVGFFQHAGEMRGNGSVRIDLTSAQLNDALQTLTAVDLGGGHVTGAGYNSTTPLDQQLRTLPLQLDADPTAQEFYQAVRGARVQVTGVGTAVTGRILNIEARTVSNLDNSAAPSVLGVQRYFLTIISDAGAVRTVELTSQVSVRMLDAGLQGDVNRYLQLLADRHTEGLRHLTLTDNGTGTRELQVSYIAEVPVWKATYRILFDGAAGGQQLAKQATLQGWAVIDNTTGTDWNSVQLSLVAGAPQSFIQPIAQPFYARRPEIGLPQEAQEAQLTPQTHESGDAPPPPAQVAGVAGAGMGYAGGSAGGIIGGLGMGAAPAPVVKAQGSGSGGGLGSGRGYGLGPGSVGNMGGGMYSNNGNAPISFEDSAAASLAANTQTAAFDDFFQYKLTDPVTIPQNRSALVPILQTKVDVDPVTLYSAATNTSLRALWVTNTGKLTLDHGSFTVLQGGSFTGEGLMDTVHPGERRLLSYAADTAIRVTPEGEPNHRTRRLQQVTVSRGILTEQTREVNETEYSVRNAAAEPRTVVVEVPRLRGWELDGDTKPQESTPDAYRFRVVAQAGETVRLHVGQRHTLSTRYALLTANEQQVTALLRDSGDAGRVRTALQPVFDAKRRVAALDTEINPQRDEITRIESDQARLRQNLQALKNSTEERALVKRYTGELNTEEDRIGTLRGTIVTLQTERDAAQRDLEAKVEALNLTIDLA